MEACGGDLQLAINMHIEGATAADANTIDSVRAPIPQTQEVLVEDTPAYGTFRGRKRKNRSVFDGFRDFQEEARQQEEEIIAGTSGSRAARKTRTLQDLFRPPVDITYKGNLANARETGIAQGKWLMVNIQNVQEFPCQALNRDIWSNSAVKALIKDNFIFWQVYHDSEEGQRYSQFYKVDQWPYVAVLDPQTGEKMIAWNKIEPFTFCDLLAEFLVQNPTMNCLSPNQPVLRKEESVIDASEDEQLQAAITASLTEVSHNTRARDSDITSESELETFTDSEDDSQASPRRRHQRSGSADSKTRSPRLSSPSKQTSPTRNSGDESSNSGLEVDSLKGKRKRCISPLACSSADYVESPRKTRKCSPLTNRETDSRVTKISSPQKTSPCRKLSPMKTTSPLKSESIHNDIHPAVLENIRRHSVSEDDGELADTTADSSESFMEDQSFDTFIDNRDYKSHLGPETDEKTTLMLRLPDGTSEKLCIAFSSKLLALVLFAGSKGFSNERYEMIAQFPRRQLSQLDYDKTLRDIGFHAQEMIFVQART